MEPFIPSPTFKRSVLLLVKTDENLSCLLLPHPMPFLWEGGNTILFDHLLGTFLLSFKTIFVCSLPTRRESLGEKVF